MKKYLIGMFVLFISLILIGCQSETDSDIMSDTEDSDSTIDTEVTSVTEDEWNEIFKNFILTNYTFELYQRGYSDEDKEIETYMDQCVVTENAVAIFDAGLEEYSFKNSDGTFTTYYREGGIDGWSNFILTSDKTDKKFRECYQYEMILFLENLFVHFTYNEDEKLYKCDDIIEVTVKGYTGESITTLLHNITVKIVDGKLVYYSFERDSEQNTSISNIEEVNVDTYVFKNIGTSKVIIPDEILESKNN